MALKDWKKIGKDLWFNLKTSEKLKVWDFSKNPMDNVASVVEVRNDTKVPSFVESSTHKTKSKGIAYAKGYMRTH